MTHKVLREEAYGNVTVAVFRDLSVAAKCLHHLIISDYNLALFSCGMNISSTSIDTSSYNLVQLDIDIIEKTK